MKELYYPLDSPLIDLGMQGTNARTIAVDVAEWIRDYGEGTVQALAQRAGESDLYPVMLRMEGTLAKWDVLKTDTAKAGAGSLMLSYITNKTEKSRIYTTNVAPALGYVDDGADPKQPYVDEVLQAGAEAAESARIASENAAAAELDRAEVAENRGIVEGAKQAVDTSEKNVREAEGRVDQTKADVELATEGVMTSERNVTSLEASAKASAESAQSSADTATSASVSAGDAASNAAGSASAAASSASAAKEDMRKVEQLTAKVDESAKKVDESARQVAQDAKTATNNASAAQDSANSASTSADAAKRDAERASGSANSAKDNAAKAQEALNEINDHSKMLDRLLTNYFNIRRTGKVFSTKFYKYEKSQSSVGEKLNANKDLICEPSTDAVAGRDDYQRIALFQHFTCNYVVDPQGFIHITALEGEKNFKKTGEVFVGEVTCSGWVGVEESADSFIVHYSDKKTDRTPYPIKESVNPDGTVNPWMVHAKYLAVDVNGKPYSSAGECPANYNPYKRIDTSYNTQVTWNHKHGNQYSGLCACDMFYRQLMLFIKYATKNSQSIMQGCTGYSLQRLVAKAESNVKHVVLATSDANDYVAGSYVSVGDSANGEKAPGRHEFTCHNIAYDVKILKIEAIDDANSALYLELDAPITTTATTWVTTFHWRTGSTDAVLGSDGSPVSNTNGKAPCKIQGIEYSLGGYEVLGNAIMDIVTGEDGVPKRDVYICNNSHDLTTDIVAIRQKYKKSRTQIPYTNASWKYISELDIDPEIGMMVIKEAKASGSSVGFGDGVYTDTGTSGQRELLCVGILDYWSFGGLFCLHAYYGLGYTNWNCLAGVSPNGCRGEYEANAK